jgi:hypothetical protein
VEDANGNNKFTLDENGSVSSLDVGGSIKLSQLNAPGALYVTPQGTGGSTTWCYRVVTLDRLGNQTLPNAEVCTNAGNATLDNSNYNRVYWSSAAQAYQYQVWRTTAGGAPNTTGLIATVAASRKSAFSAAFYYDDKGAAGNGASLPTVNTTGLLQLAGNLQMPAGAFANFGATVGAGGYGFQDDGGTLKGKNAGGAWAAFSFAGHGHSAADITSGILGSAYGGTGNGFTKFTGPATTEKTFTLPNASATILTTNDPVTVAQVASVLKTRQFGYIAGSDSASAVLADTDDQQDIYVNRLGQGITITEVWCGCDAGSPTIQLQKDDGTPTDMLSSNLTCSTGAGASTTSFVSGENSIADGDRVDFKLVSAGGVAKRITVYVKYTLD